MNHEEMLEQFNYRPHTHCFLGRAVTPTLDAVWDAFVVPFKPGTITTLMLRKLYHYKDILNSTLSVHQVRDLCNERLRDTQEVQLNHITMNEPTYNRIIADVETLQEFEKYFTVTISESLPYGVLLIEHETKIDNDDRKHRVPYVQQPGRYATHPNIENYGMWIEFGKWRTK